MSSEWTRGKVLAKKRILFGFGAKKDVLPGVWAIWCPDTIRYEPRSVPLGYECPLDMSHTHSLYLPRQAPV